MITDQSPWSAASLLDVPRIALALYVTWKLATNAYLATYGLRRPSEILSTQRHHKLPLTKFAIGLERQAKFQIYDVLLSLFPDLRQDD